MIVGDATFGPVAEDTSSRNKAGCDKDMTSMHMAKHGEWREDERDVQGFPSRVEDPKLIRFESQRWRPKTTQV